MILRRTAFTLLLAALPSLALVACSEPDDEPDDPYVVANIPWTAPEAYSYVLLDEDGDEQGTSVLSVAEDGERFVFTTYSSDDNSNSDETVLVTDKDALRPLAGRRTIVDADEDRREIAQTEYGELDDGSYGVRIEQLSYHPRTDVEEDSRRCNPLKVPESAFDNDSSLFLWRTLEFEEDQVADYTAVISNRRRKVIITLTVREQQRVETPAGDFDAWFVTIEGPQQSHEAWFATTPEHRLLKYDNDDLVFLYTGEVEDVETPGLPEGVPADCKR